MKKRKRKYIAWMGIFLSLFLVAVILPQVYKNETWKIGLKEDEKKKADSEHISVAEQQAESVSVDEGVVEQPKIALTFDDGPSASWTPILLDGLKERGVKATFFLIGENVEAGENAQIVKRMCEEGHLIGNHTYHHVEITRVDHATALEELQRTNEVITKITGEPVEYMRPPFGAWQKDLEKEVQLIPVLWSVDPLDWTTTNTDEIVNKVVTETGENDMILLHDCYESSIKAALRIVDLLTEEGYEFVTVDQLILE